MTDCLIKLTKAGLREDICNALEIAIPHLVKEEIVDGGKARKRLEGWAGG